MAVTPSPPDDGAIQTGEYCRQIEAYLCRKNDGHLIRIVGPSFDVVRAWAGRGIPIKVVEKGIDRYFERYYRQGQRRRPVRIDFCEADVLDVFDDWRRAVGVGAVVRETAAGASAPVAGDGETEAGGSDAAAPRRRGPSLRAHIDRALTKLSSFLATAQVPPETRAAVEHIAAALTDVAPEAVAARGDARSALVDRLDALDVELLQAAVTAVPPAGRSALEDRARLELEPFRQRMPADAYTRSLAAALGRLARERAGLPILRYER